MMSLRCKISYGAAEFGTQFSWTFVGSYLTVFYTDIVGFTPAVISMIMLVARCFDAFDDPLMGMIAERTRTRWGRFRPWLLFMAPMLALFNVLTFVNAGLPRTWQIVFSLASYMLCGAAYSMTSICVGSLPNVASYEKEDRVSMNVHRNIGGSVAGVIINAVTMPLLMQLSGGTSGNSRSYVIVAALYSAVCLVSLLIAFRGTEEKIGVPRSQKQVKAHTGLLIVLKDRNTMTLIIAMTFFLTGIFGRLGIMLYYYLYVLNDPALVAPLSTLLSVSMLLPLLFVPWLTRFVNLKTLMSVSCVICASGCLLMFLMGRQHVGFVFAGTFLLGAGNWVSFCSGPIVAEIIDDVQVRTSQRVDGTIYSCVSFATKVGNTVGGSVGILLLSAAGFVPNTVQNAATVQGMNAVINLIPMALFLIAALVFRAITIDNHTSERNIQVLKQRDPAAATQELIDMIRNEK